MKYGSCAFQVIFDTREEHEYHHGVKSPAGGGPRKRPAAPLLTLVLPPPDVNAFYHWTFKGANKDTITADSVQIKWTSYPDTLWVTGIDTVCHDTLDTMLVIINCCVPQDSVLYVLTNDSLTQIKSGTGTGVVHDTLPSTPITGGISVSNADIYIFDTLVVNENLELLGCNVYMAPNAVIIVDSGVTFTLDTALNGDTTSISACYHMWRGIRLQPTDTFISYKAYVGEADTAVHVKGRAVIDIISSSFARNYVSLFIDSDENDTMLYPLTLSGDYFSPQFDESPYLLAPYPEGTPMHIGIDLRKVANVVIGDSTLQRNYFSGMDTAINIVASGVTANNDYIGGADTGVYRVRVGIRAYANVGVTTLIFFGTHSAIFSIGPSLALGNENMHNSLVVLGCDTGILASLFVNSAIEIAYDSIHSNDSTGLNIVIQNASSPVWTAINAGLNFDTSTNISLIHIHDNQVVSGRMGIQYVPNGSKGSVSAGVTISNNTIDMGPSTAKDNLAIEFNNVLNLEWFKPSSYFPFYPRDTFNNNTILQAYNGIWSVQTVYQEFNNNSITLRAGGPGIQHGGITAWLPYNTNLTCNTVAGADSTNENDQYGIELHNTFWNTVQCNELTGLGRGININYGGIVSLLNNKMQSSAVGIGLDQNCIINTQGNYTGDTTNDNEWKGSFSGAMIKTYNGSNITGNTDSFIVRTNPADYFNPPVTTANIQPALKAPVSSVIAINDTISCDTACPNTHQLFMPIHQILAAINDTIPASDSLSSLDSATYVWWNQYNLFNSLLFVDTSITNDSLVNAFIMHYDSSSAGQLLQMQSQIAMALAANDTSADTLANYESILDTITPANDMEINIQWYLQTYLEYMQGGLVDLNGQISVKETFQQLAQLCVFYEGPAVLQARALLIADSLDLLNYDWDDSCIIIESRMAGNGYVAPQDTNSVAPPAANYHLIPNLFKDNLTAIITLGADEQGEVDIYNIDGILMGKNLVSGGINEIDLSGDNLSAGLYLYKVYVNGQLKTNDKLVIVH